MKLQDTIERATEIKELAKFLAQQNNEKASHIGYCGRKEAEIYQTLQEDFVDGQEVSFFVAKEAQQIVAAIGLDIDGNQAEVWGPFNRMADISLQWAIWDQLISAYPQIEIFEFFINTENIMQQAFVEELGAKKTGEHLILEIQAAQFQPVTEKTGRNYEASDFNAFNELHSETFPNTYYDAQTIVERISENCKVTLVKTPENELQGYAYYEFDSSVGEANLEFIAIAPSARNQGVGTRLLKEVLAEIFAQPNIHEIILCVDNQNQRANHVYVKAGFERKEVLWSYTLK